MVCERFVTFVHMFSVQYVFSRYSLPLLALLVAIQAHAQHGGVVVHMETGIPLRDVVVMTNTGERAKSDYRGQFQLTKPFTSLNLSHSGFVPLSLERSQMSDTLALMPQFNTLEEVTVWGKGRHVEDKAVEMPSYIRGFQRPSGHDFLSIFQKHVVLNAKQRKKHRWIMENYCNQRPLCDKTYHQPV